MEARVVGAETRAEIAEEKVRFISCLHLVKVILCSSSTIYRRPRNQSGGKDKHNSRQRIAFVQFYSAFVEPLLLSLLTSFVVKRNNRPMHSVLLTVNTTRNCARLF